MGREGRRYLDAFAGIVTISVGHCHPKVVERVREQTGKLQHTTTIYLHPAIVQFAEKLAEKMPPGLTRSYFTNSGSEANEIAILSAREYTGNQDVIAPAQRLSRRHVGADEPHGARHVEIQDRTTARTCITRWPAIVTAARSALSTHPAA